MLKVLAFDVFGTVFDFSKVPKKEIGNYVRHVKDDGPWKPLDLPSTWEHLSAHPDAKEGIELLRENYLVVTMSNGPMKLLAQLSRNNKISWDAIIPIECRKVYKPHPEAYLMACDLLGVEPFEVMMVTANPTFGDVEAAGDLGMVVQVIRHGFPETIVQLAELVKFTDFLK